MAQISETYASPGLRVGLLYEDHPEADVVYSAEIGTDIGIPPEAGGNGRFCVATIIFPSGKRRIGWKAMPEDGMTADEWNKMCTQALGRALKRAGYPDDTSDLKLLVTWRQRKVELARLSAGVTQVALPSANDEARNEALGTGSIDPVQRALDVVGVATASGGDDGEGEVGADDDIAVGEVVGDAEMVIELMEGLNAKDAKLFDVFVNGTLNVTSDDPREWSASQISEALGWLDPDGDDD